MDAESAHDLKVADIAGAIGEPTRARILFGLMDGRASTSTELAMTADVGPSTASAHLNRLLDAGLIHVAAQGRHRYFSLAGAEVAAVLEGLARLAGPAPAPFQPATPPRLRAARTCYDHMAGAFGVSLHDALVRQGWVGPDEAGAYQVTTIGEDALRELGVDVGAARLRRRRFAYPCLDWSERRPHLGGALAAALLDTALKRGWVARELDSRALEVTDDGRRAMSRHFARGALELPAPLAR